MELIFLQIFYIRLLQTKQRDKCSIVVMCLKFLWFRVCERKFNAGEAERRKRIRSIRPTFRLYTHFWEPEKVFLDRLGNPRFIIRWLPAPTR